MYDIHGWVIFDLYFSDWSFARWETHITYVRHDWWRNCVYKKSSWFNQFNVVYHSTCLYSFFFLSAVQSACKAVLLLYKSLLNSTTTSREDNYCTVLASCSRVCRFKYYVNTSSKKAMSGSHTTDYDVIFGHWTWVKWPFLRNGWPWTVTWLLSSKITHSHVRFEISRTLK